MKDASIPSVQAKSEQSPCHYGITRGTRYYGGKIMLNQSTIDKLIEMRLTAMSDAFRNQLNDPGMKDVPFENRFGMLVDIEFTSRKNNRLNRLIRNADLEQTNASIIDIDYTSGRKLNKPMITRLASGE
jgi:hypothetical protein